MLSIGPISSVGYYTKIQAEDYYTRDTECLGRWWGHGARSLGLSDPVDAETLERLLQGFSP